MQQENLGQSVSLWMATAAAPNRSALAEDARAGCVHRRCRHLRDYDRVPVG